MTSWLGVFKKTGLYEEISTMDRLIEAVKENRDLSVSGSFHSYNARALQGTKNIKLVGDAFSGIELIKQEDGTYNVVLGSAATVESVMNYLLDRGFRLVNAGNYRKQTMVGAILGGTHGFGPRASLADAVNAYWYLDDKGKFQSSKNIGAMIKKKCILGVSMDIERVGSFKVTAQQKTLSDLQLLPDQRKAFLILPYTDEENPMVIETCYYPIEESATPALFSKKKAWDIPMSAWKLKLFWGLDSLFPCFRSLLQKILNYVRIPSWELITSPRDIDSLYHPWPGIDDINNKPKFSLWAFKPTYTGYNISLFFEESDFKEAVLDICHIANNPKATGFKRNFLFSFIGCRYLSDTTNVSFVGNHKKRVVAVDIYSKPKHAQELIDLQRYLQDNYSARSHRGKTV